MEKTKISTGKEIKNVIVLRTKKSLNTQLKQYTLQIGTVVIYYCISTIEIWNINILITYSDEQWHGREGNREMAVWVF